MGSAALPQITAAFHGALCRRHGPCTLEDGITLTLQQATLMIAQGYSRPHISQNEGLRAFASEAGGCERAIGLRMLNLKPLDLTPELATTFLAGDLLHDDMQAGLTTLFPDLSVEHSWCTSGISGRADGVYISDAEISNVVEIKSTSLPGFKYAMWKGPKQDHIFHAGLSALHLGAPDIHIIYISKAPCQTAKKTWADPQTPEFISVMDWFMQIDLDQIQDEWDRLAALAPAVLAGTIGDTVNAQGWIANPEETKWPCAYCAALPLCLQLGEGPQPLAKLLALRPAHEFPVMKIAENRI